MNMLGGRSNTGEGGEDSAVYRVQPVGRGVCSGASGGMSLLARAPAEVTALAEPVVEAPAVHVSLNNKIKQVASGRFGVTAEYLSMPRRLKSRWPRGRSLARVDSCRGIR